MSTQTILWTCLPNGIDKSVTPNVLNLSIIISPRLSGGATKTLSDYPQFVDWPATLKAMGKLNIKIGSAAAISVNLPLFNSALWKAIFPPSTFVRPYVFEDQTPNYVFSYPVSNIANTLKGVYQNVAVNSPLTPPSKVDILEKYEIVDLIPQNPYEDNAFYQLPLSLPLGTELERILGSMRDQKAKYFPPSYDSYTGNLNGYEVSNQSQYDLFQMAVFHQPRTQTVPDSATGYPLTKLGTLPAAADYQNIIDFHQQVASIGKFPALMRELGLVIDLQIPTAGIAFTGGTINVVLSAPNVTPYTVLSQGGDFKAAISGSTGDLRPGYLDLTANSNHELVEFDVDGAAMKLLAMAGTLAQSRVYNSKDTPSAIALASMRSAGLSLIRRNRAQLLTQAFQAAKTNNNNIGSKSVYLYAEDLVRGYRVDVSDTIDPKWHSLFQRIGKYVVVNNTALSASAIPDEGFTQLAATTPPNTVVPTKDLYLHESLLRWDGWSLAAPRPGNTITDSAQPVGNPAVPGIGLSATFTVPPKTLPRLRYGRSYRFRARSVDLAGNSLPPTDPIGTYATDLKYYARFEPVVAPVLVLRVTPGTGESLTEVVIRSYNATTAMDTVATNETTDRHIVPPRVAQEVGETHGMFDNSSGVRPDVYSQIAANDANFSSIKVGPADSPSVFPIFPAPQAKIPYLPDPMSVGATFQYLPGVPATSVKQFFFNDVGTWPDVTPFRLMLVEGPIGYSYDATKRILTISLPKGATTTLNLMSAIPPTAPGVALGASPPPALELLGVWKLIEAAAPANLSTLKGQAMQSRLWMLTPPRTINLTHAVQQPLVIPTFVTVTPRKFLGNTYAEFLGTIKTDGQTTSQLDFDATWSEPYDNPDDPLSLHPDTDRVNAHSAAFQMQLRFPGPLMGPFAVTSPTTINDDAGNIRGTYNIPTKVLTLGVLTNFGYFNVPRHEFGDTKYRRVSYTPIGTSRYREFYTLPITDISNPYIRKQATPTVLDIPNSARPLAPQILYVVPTFRHDVTTKSAKRYGGGLRVYMDRPWFSSGDGELLGAVLWNSTYVKRGTTVLFQNTLPDKFKPYVTMWGSDPAYTAAAPEVVPAQTHFTNKAVTTGFNTTTLTLDELPGETVSVAAHNVAFDADRNLWYCDIDISPLAYYMPFVRLALARYQPHSIDGAHLSRVVLTEFVQLTPDRSATLVQAKTNAVQVTVTGFSYLSAQSYISGNPFPGPSIVVASLEYRTTNDPAGDAAWIPLPQYELRLTSKAQSNGTSLWTGVLTLPVATAGNQYRIVIREYELVNSSSTALPAYLPETSFELGYRRLVFAESIDATAFVPRS